MIKYISNDFNEIYLKKMKINGRNCEFLKKNSAHKK